MAVTYPINMPTTIGIADINFRMVNAEAMSASPYTGKFQQYKWPDQHWEVDITLPSMKRDQAREWFSFLAKLKAGSNSQFPTFLLYDPSYVKVGSHTGTFLASNGSDPNTLSASGFAASTNSVLAAGDMIRIGSSGASRIHMVVEDVDSTGAGAADVTIWPACYQTLSSSSVYCDEGQVYGAFVLNNPVQSYNINSNNSYQINFTARGLV